MVICSFLNTTLIDFSSSCLCRCCVFVLYLSIHLSLLQHENTSKIFMSISTTSHSLLSYIGLLIYLLYPDTPRKYLTKLLAVIPRQQCPPPLLPPEYFSAVQILRERACMARVCRAHCDTLPVSLAEAALAMRSAVAATDMIQRFKNLARWGGGMVSREGSAMKRGGAVSTKSTRRNVVPPEASISPHGDQDGRRASHGRAKEGAGMMPGDVSSSSGTDGIEECEGDGMIGSDDESRTGNDVMSEGDLSVDGRVEELSVQLRLGDAMWFEGGLLILKVLRMAGVLSQWRQRVSVWSAS